MVDNTDGTDVTGNDNASSNAAADNATNSGDDKSLSSGGANTSSGGDANASSGGDANASSGGDSNASSGGDSNAAGVDKPASADGADSGSNASAGAGKPSGGKAAIKYDVELIVQEANPICWVACCAMVEGYGTKLSVGVGKYTGGFDPSDSCIPNLAQDWQGSLDFMRKWKFEVYSVQQLAGNGTTITVDDLRAALSQKGPLILLHKCVGFPYGSGWDLSKLTNQDAHAVVLTGIDSDNGLVWFNNPWGNKDRSATLNTIIQHMNADASRGTVGCWPAK